MPALRFRTPVAWVDAVRADPIAFLQDHAANERKIAVSALNLAAEHPRRTGLVGPLIEAAREELEHFQQVHAVLEARGATLGRDGPQRYIGALRKITRSSDAGRYLLDRLLVFAIIEARACERFTLLADALDDDELRAFYTRLTAAEARHHGLYVRLARQEFSSELIDPRYDELLEFEGEVIAELPVRAALF